VLAKEGIVRAALLCLCSLLLFGQPAFADDKDKLVGAWKIVSAVVEDVQTKEQKPLYGDHPRGYLILLASRRMMSLLVSEGRKAPQTDKERSDAYRSMVAYSGKFTLEGNKWITKLDVAWNEAWLVDQERYFRIEGDKLYIETAPQFNPNFGKLVRVTLVWEREN
jgi:Lipocalin-like domain